MVTSSGSNGPTMLGVLSNIAKEPTNRLLVVVVLLAFDDDLLPSVDELIATLFWEVFFREEMVSTIVVLLNGVLVLLWNTASDVLLRNCLRKMTIHFE